MATQQFRVKYDFTAEDPVELSCKTGEVVTSTEKEQGGWQRVTSKTGTGLVPSSYLMVTTPAAAPSAPPVATVVSASPRNAPGLPVAAVVDNVALQHAECPICFDDMVSRPACVMRRRDGKRCCGHYLHLSCAQSLRTQQCPMCRAQFDNVQEIPNFDQDPQMWFQVVDADGNLSLSKFEVFETLKALVAVDYRKLEQNVDSLWPKWDKDGSGEIDYRELCDPKDGLLAYVRTHFARQKQAEPPKLMLSSRQEWFKFWDEDGNGNGNLCKEEILRALIKTFHISASTAKVNELREVLNNVWVIFDTDGSGEIEMKEFLQLEGLGETLIASLGHMSS